MIFLLFLAISFFIYCSNLHAGVVGDDLAVLAAVNRRSFKEVLRGPRPLPMAVFYIIFWLTGQEKKELTQVKTTCFHIVNVIMHAANAACVYYLIERIILWVGGISGETLKMVVLLSVIYFLVQPLAVNAVANISGLYSLMSTFFCLTALLSALTGHGVLFALSAMSAFLSKQDTVLLPFQTGLLLALLGISAWPYFVGPIGIVAILMATKRLRWGQKIQVSETGWPAPMAQWPYIKTFVYESMIRILKWFLGFGYELQPYPKEASWFGFALTVEALLMGTSFLWMLSPAALALLICSPWSAYIVKRLPDPIMEHRAYGLMLGMSLLAGSALALLPLWLAAIVLTAFAFTAKQRTALWAPGTLWWAAVTSEGSNNPQALLNLSSEYIHAGRLNEAKPLIAKALSLAPNAWHAWANLGTIAAKEQNATLQAAFYQRGAIRCKRFLLAWETLAKIYEGSGRYARAAACYRHLARIAYDDASRYHHMSKAHAFLLAAKMLPDV